MEDINAFREIDIIYPLLPFALGYLTGTTYFMQSTARAADLYPA